MTLTSNLKSIFIKGCLLTSGVVFFALISILTIEFCYNSFLGKKNYGEFYKKNSKYDDIDFLNNTSSFFHSKKFSPSPFLGVTYNSIMRNINIHGLHKNNVLPDKKKDCVIGIFGGSVAEHFAHFVMDNIEIYKNIIRDKLQVCRNKKVIVQNFSFGAGKQPQQFIAFSLLAEHIDVSINIDGFNELVLDPGLNYPVAFPYFTQEMFFLNDQKIEKLKQLRRIHYLERKVFNFGLSKKNLMTSHLYYKFSKLILSYSKNKKKLIRSQIRVNKNSRATPDGVRFKKKIKIWEKYTESQNHMAKKYKIQSFFFIQPNQYIKDSKPFSEEEKRIALSSKDAPIYKRLSSLYFQLEVKRLELEKKKVNIHSLVNIFKNLNEQVYQDSCCHLNRKGNEKMFEAIFSKISKKY